MADLSKINVNNTEYDLKDSTARSGLSTKYDSSDTAETTLADDDKIPFYDTSASGKRNSTWANIKAKLNGCETKNETTPYLYRQSEANGDRLYEKLVGASFGVNQLVENGNFADSSGWGTISVSASTLVIANGLATITVASQYTNYAGLKINSNIPKLSEHIILLCGEFYSSKVTKIRFGSNTSAGGKYNIDEVSLIANKWNNIKQIGFVASENTATSFNIYVNTSSDLIANDTVQVKNVQCIDLTSLFGTTIADYAYTLESQTAGSGIAWLQSYGFFTKDYYPYNAGELLSVKPTGKVNVGFNQCDATKFIKGRLDNGVVGYDSGTTSMSTYEGEVTFTTNADYRGVVGDFIKVTSGESVYFNFTSNNSSDTTYLIDFFDENKVWLRRLYPTATLFTIPNDCSYIRHSFQKNTSGTLTISDICINISKPTGSPKNGDYEPYTEYTYPITTELRGVPKLVGDDIVYDGDVDDGKSVQRKYSEEVSGSLFALHNTSSAGYKTYKCTLATAKEGVYLIENFGLKHVSSFDSSSVSEECIQPIPSNKMAFIAIASTRDISNFKCIYELAIPTTEPSNGFTMPQIVSPDGTEQFVDSRDFPIPVGHDTAYVKVPSWMEEYYPKDFRDRVDESHVETATSATNDSDGNAINTTYMKKGVDYVTAGRKSGTTLGTGATAEGSNTTASGDYSHAEGYNTTTIGYASHAEGYNTTTNNNAYSHAEGYNTKNGSSYQHVQGIYNVGKNDTAFEIGNGTGDNARSNAFEVTKTGRINNPSVTIEYLQNNKIALYKIGRVVVMQCFGWVCNDFSNGWNTLIPQSTMADFNPVQALTFLGVIYNGENANYIATCDVDTSGRVWVRFKNTINTMSGGIASSYPFWGTGCWITAS